MESNGIGASIGIGGRSYNAIRRDRGRKPDLAVYLVRQQLPRNGAVTTPPDIAVEVVSPTPRDERRDRIEKMDEYAAFGIRFYWILDPWLQSLEIFELTDAVPAGSFSTNAL
ncbi:MAG TPA: Uma2 family endonuclease [Thermoanaerobaculia bacterium]|nr:Uma2 family endonuclease [Thermoanaerobaculia bacterium]